MSAVCTAISRILPFSKALALGRLSAIGPFAIDTYLPALPLIGHGLDAPMGAVQASPMLFCLAGNRSAAVWAPVSDMGGRKPPLYVDLLRFAVCSVGCALAPAIQVLIVLRFPQGPGFRARSPRPRSYRQGNAATRYTRRFPSLQNLPAARAPARCA